MKDKRIRIKTWIDNIPFSDIDTDIDKLDNVFNNIKKKVE